jgi:hypothetical protein
VLRLRLALLLSACLLGLAACGGDDSASTDGADTQEGPIARETRQELNGADKPARGDFPDPSDFDSLQALADSIGATGTQVGAATTVYERGRNRIAFGVIDDQNRFVYGPTAIYLARNPDRGAVRGPYLAPADLLVTEPAFRSQQAATEEDPFAAIYEATRVPLNQSGRWAMLVLTKVSGRLVAAAGQLDVKDESPIPDVGDEAPQVVTDTVESAGSLEAIDTRKPPARELHEESFSDVVGEKPVALLFATPQLCQSRVCGPVTDIALQLHQRFGDRVQFIHQEVFEGNNAQNPLREPLREFNLQTEPWLFTVDRDGRIAARLEGSFGLRAFQDAVEASLR